MTMTKEKLDQILAEHAKGLNDRATGKIADLKEAELQGADLRNANLQYADLKKANLRGADLRQANLQFADLRNADLRGADLRKANLQSAYLRQANLSEANLRQANLLEAKLEEALLLDSNLHGADLQGANLRGADLRGACLDYASWPLWCGSLNVKVDECLLRQLMFHLLSLVQGSEVDANVKRQLLTALNLEFANKFHLVEDETLEPLNYSGDSIIDAWKLLEQIYG